MTEVEGFEMLRRLEGQRPKPKQEYELKRLSDFPPPTERDILRIILGWKVNEAKSQKARWDAIREYYAIAIESITEQPANRRAISCHDVDWYSLCTPIEKIIFEEAEWLGMVLYPQFPIGPFFVDFANPVAKLVIECDGKAFHDAEKDGKRDAYLKARGWSVYRFTGAECHRVDRQDNGLHISDDPAIYGYEFMPSEAAIRLREIGVTHCITWRRGILAEMFPISVHDSDYGDDCE